MKMSFWEVWTAPLPKGRMIFPVTITPRCIARFSRAQYARDFLNMIEQIEPSKMVSFEIKMVQRARL